MASFFIVNFFDFLGKMRLNQFIAHAGICSRRKAEALIANGAIQVNGARADHPGKQIAAGDVVMYQGQRLLVEKKVYWLLNKPFNCITTLSDPENRKMVQDYLPREANFPRLYPVGRLDRNTTGLLLLTNDGYLAKGLSHPSLKVNKSYELLLKKRLAASDLAAIRKGLVLEDGLVKVDGIYPKDATNKCFSLRLHSGKNRIIRRIFKKVGYQLLALDRVGYAGLSLKGLGRGQGRYLTAKEVKGLYQKAKLCSNDL